MSIAKPLSLKTSVLLTFTGIGVWSLCNWLMASVITKLGSPVKFGMYSLGNSICSPVFMFSYMGLRSYMITDIGNKYKFRDYFSLRLVTSTLAQIAITVFACIVYPGTRALVISIVSAGMWFDSISDVIYSIFQRHDRANCVAVSMVTKGILNLTMLGTAMFITRNIVWAAAANSVSSLIIVALYDSPTGFAMLKKDSPDGRKITLDSALSLFTPKALPIMWSVMVFAVPLALVNLFVTTTGNVPQLFIGKMLGERQLGLYSAAAYLINIGRIGVMAAGYAASPYMARAYSGNRYVEYRNIVFKIALIGIFLAIAAPIFASLVGKKTMTVLYTSEYAQQTQLIVLILLAGGIRYLTSLMGYSVTSAGFFVVQIYWFGAALAVGIVSCWWLIPREGLEGAAVASLIAAGTEVVIGTGGLNLRALEFTKQDINVDRPGGGSFVSLLRIDS